MSRKAHKSLCKYVDHSVDLCGMSRDPFENFMLVKYFHKVPPCVRKNKNKPKHKKGVGNNLHAAIIFKAIKIKYQKKSTLIFMTFRSTWIQYINALDLHATSSIKLFFQCHTKQNTKKET